jgi:hypothetical protein
MVARARTMAHLASWGWTHMMIREWPERHAL